MLTFKKMLGPKYCLHSVPTCGDKKNPKPNRNNYATGTSEIYLFVA